MMSGTLHITHRKHFLMTAVLVLCCGLACQAIEPGHMRKQYERCSISELRNHGHDCVARLSADSALMFYTMAASRYEEARTPQEREDCAVAAINAGYVCLFMLNRPEQAYPRIRRGIEMCRKEGLHKYIPIANNYLANIHASFGNEDEAMALFRKAFYGSVKEEVDWSVIMSYTDMMSYAWERGRLQNMKREMTKFETLGMRGGEPLADYAHDIHRGMQSFAEGDYASARQWFSQALKDNDAPSGREHGDLMTRMYLADACAAGADLKSAVSIARDAEEQLQHYDFRDLSRIVYGKLADYYTLAGKPDSAQYFYYKGLEIRTSDYNAGRYGKIKDLETSFLADEFDRDLQRVGYERDLQHKKAVIFAIAGTVILLLLIWSVIKHLKLTKAYRKLYKKNMEALAIKEEKQSRWNSDKAKDDAHNLWEKINSVIDNTDEIYSPDFSIDRLAALTESNPRYVSHAISVKGQSDFRTIVARRRIAEACRRLVQEASEGQYTIGAIALQVGYKSRTHFSKLFKEITGLTPSEFLRQAKNDHTKEA